MVLMMSSMRAWQEVVVVVSEDRDWIAGEGEREWESYNRRVLKVFGEEGDLRIQVVGRHCGTLCCSSRRNSCDWR